MMGRDRECKGYHGFGFFGEHLHPDGLPESDDVAPEDIEELYPAIVANLESSHQNG